MNPKQLLPVVSIGTAIVDCLVKGFDPVPVSASGFVAESADLAPGGEAINESAAFCKLGMPVRTVCFTGRDRAADILTGELASLGADLSYIVRPEGVKTPVTVMFVDEKGDRRSITNTAHRYNFHPEADMSYMEGAQAVSLGSLFRAPFNDPGVVRTVVAEAVRRGLPVYADTKLPNARALTLADLADVLPSIECIFPNENEAAFYSGKTDPEEMADVFLSYGIKNAVIKLGEKGCLFKNAAETIRLPGLPVPAVDATGAGDNFIAGFITMRCEGASYADALRFANACGAASTLAVGASAGLKDRAQVLALLAQSGR